MPEKKTSPLDAYLSANQKAKINAFRKAFYEQEARLNGHQGSLKSFLEANEDACSKMRVNEVRTLPRDVFQEFDREAVDIMKKQLVVYEDLRSAVGKNIPVGKTVTNFRRRSESSHPVSKSFDGRNSTTVDQHTTDYVPTAVPLLG